MPYITSVEQIGRKEGLQQGSLEEGRELVLEALDERFGDIPSLVFHAIHQIHDRNLLRALLRRAIRCASLEEFQQALNGNSTNLKK